jgi:hypothetical protein
MKFDRMTNAGAWMADDLLLLFGVKATYDETKCPREKFIRVYYFFERHILEKEIYISLGYNCSVLVAGVGFEPTTFRL